MRNRNQIEEKYKWEITAYKSIEEAETTFKKAQKYVEIIKACDGKLNDADTFFKFANAYTQIELIYSKLGYYISNTLNVDSSNVEMLKLSQKYGIEAQKVNLATAHIEPQLYKLSDKYLRELLLDKRAKNLDNFILDIIKEKPHALDEQTNVILTKISRCFSNSSEVFDVFTDSEMPFKDALDKNGKPHKIDNATYGVYVSKPDRVLRKNAFNSMMDGYGAFNKTFATLYTKDIAGNIDLAKLKKFNTVLEKELFDSDIPIEVFNKNIEVVRKHIPLMQEFIKLQSKLSGLKDYAYYDLFVDTKINTKISIEEAQLTILKALAPLGDEYLEKVKQKFNDKSIDYLPNKNKNSGGYCSNCYGAKTLILMNYTYDYDSLSTLIHEMGHAINAEYFNTLPAEKAGIEIFNAEIASTVNETLLSIYMQNNSNTKDKIYYLHEFLDRARSTIFRQTLFSEFEYFAYSQIEKEIPLTYKELNEKYYSLCKEYFGNSLVIPKNLQYEWSRIPHFYNVYYVFAYSTGLISAIAIVSKILSEKDYYKKYIKFLKNGISKKPLDILKEIDIDLTTSAPYETAFNFIKNCLKEYKKLTTNKKVSKK